MFTSQAHSLCALVRRCISTTMLCREHSAGEITGISSLTFRVAFPRLSSALFVLLSLLLSLFSFVLFFLLFQLSAPRSQPLVPLLLSSPLFPLVRDQVIESAWAFSSSLFFLLFSLLVFFFVAVFLRAFSFLLSVLRFPFLSPSFFLSLCSFVFPSLRFVLLCCPFFSPSCLLLRRPTGSVWPRLKI